MSLFEIVTDKPIFRSRTVWTSFIAVISVIINNHFGFVVIDQDAQTGLFFVLAVILRIITKKPISFT